MNKDRDYFYLQFSDIPDEDDEIDRAYREDEIDKAYKDVPEDPVRPLETQEIIGQVVSRQAFGDAGCKSCSEGVGGDFLAHLKAQWNAGLGLQEVRLCSQCGQTTLCTRVKDSPNKYIGKCCDN